jgi:hypothetical protein
MDARYRYIPMEGKPLVRLCRALCLKWTWCFGAITIFGFFFFFFFFGVTGLNPGLCTCKTSSLLLQPQLQSILLLLFWG